MFCKDCETFDTAPGMKWGICKKNDSAHVPSILKGPGFECKYDEVKEDIYYGQRKSSGTL